MAHHRYLLDTNILSDLIKNPRGPVAGKIANLESDTLCCTSILVACELRYGAEKKGSAPLTSRVNELLEVMNVVGLDDTVIPHYARLRTSLEKSGPPIGSNDLLIAAQACALGLTMVTANSREFCRIPGLPVENWLRDTLTAP